MDTENNSCKLFGLRCHDEHYELKCDQFTVGSDHRGRFITFTGRSTKTYKGGLKDLELKNKKITRYCQEGKTFSVLLLHIIKKGALAHLLKEQKTFENIHIYCNYVYHPPPPSPFPGQTYMYCFCPVCPSVTVTNFVSTVSSVPFLHVLCILDT